MSQQLLVAQDEALTGFLDDLLAEDTAGASPAAEEPASETVQAAPVETVSSMPEIEAEPEAEMALAETEKSENTYSPPMDDSRVPILPDWGLRPFQAMVFKVGELSLAIPVTELAEVIEWTPGVEASSSKGLCLGQYQHDGQPVTVVDIARLIFAGNQLDKLLVKDASQRVTRIILINNKKLGLAVDAVYEVITIQPTRVNWRSTRTRRQWLAGTMLDEMIVVLDTQSTTKILSDLLTAPE